MTPEETIIFKKGFKVAINFLIHHHLDAAGDPDPAAKELFREFLLKTTDTDEEKLVIEEAIDLKTTMSGGGNCSPGECSIGGKCVLCAFGIAFEGFYHS